MIEPAEEPGHHLPVHPRAGAERPYGGCLCEIPQASHEGAADRGVDRFLRRVPSGWDCPALRSSSSAIWRRMTGPRCVWMWIMRMAWESAWDVSGRIQSMTGNLSDFPTTQSAAQPAARCSAQRLLKAQRIHHEEITSTGFPVMMAEELPIHSREAQCGERVCKSV